MRIGFGKSGFANMFSLTLLDPIAKYWATSFLVHRFSSTGILKPFIS